MNIKLKGKSTIFNCGEEIAKFLINHDIAEKCDKKLKSKKFYIIHPETKRKIYWDNIPSDDYIIRIKSYGHNLVDTKIRRYGLEFEAGFNSIKNYNIVTFLICASKTISSLLLSIKGDSSIHARTGAEFVSVPTSKSNLLLFGKYLADCMKFVNENPEECGCGIHIHISKNKMLIRRKIRLQEIGKYLHTNKLLVPLVGRNPNSYASFDTSLLSQDALISLLNKENKELQLNSGRYYFINETSKTIEFRLFSGTNNNIAIEKYIMVLDLFLNLSKTKVKEKDVVNAAINIIKYGKE